MTTWVAAVVGALAGSLTAVVAHLLTRRDAKRQYQLAKDQYELAKDAADKNSKLIEAQTDKTKIETDQIRADLERNTANLSNQLEYRLSQSQARVLYDGRQSMDGFDFQFEPVESADGDLTVRGQGADAPYLALRRTNTSGRVMIRLQSYFINGDRASVIPSGQDPGPSRRLRVQGEARVVGGAHTLLVRVKGDGDPPGAYLGEKRERLTSDAWHEFDAFFEVPADRDCGIRFDDRSVSAAPSTLEIRKIVVSERAR